MDWIKNYNILIQGLILSGLILMLLSFVLLILIIFKKQLVSNKIQYVYAYSSGFMIVTAIIGQWVSARTLFFDFFEKQNNGSHEMKYEQILIVLAIVIFAFLLGSLIGFSIKYFTIKSICEHNPGNHKSNHKHSHHHVMDVPHEVLEDLDKNKNSLVFMILSHRLPAGLILGILLVNYNKSISEFAFGSLLAFVLHIIPEIITIYYAKLQIYKNKWKAFWFSLKTNILLIPFIFLGIVISHYSDLNSWATFWILPLLLIIAGIVMIWGSIFELGPLFIHIKVEKQTYQIIFIFIFGLISSLAIQLIHIH